MTLKHGRLEIMESYLLCDIKEVDLILRDTFLNLYAHGWWQGQVDVLCGMP